MKLSPLEIRKQDFDRSLRGYNPDEVEAFLNTVAAQWEEMVEERRRLHDRVEKLENQLQHYQRVEEALQETLDQTRRNAEQQLENARGKADNIIREAKADARDIKQDAEAKRDRLSSEVKDLQNRRSQIVARLRAFLASEMEILRQYQEGDFLISEEGEDPGDTYEQLSQSLQLEGWASGAGSSSDNASSGSKPSTPDEPPAEDSRFEESDPPGTDVPPSSPLDDDVSRLGNALGEPPDRGEDTTPPPASGDDTDFADAFGSTDSPSSEASVPDDREDDEDEDDAMNFSSVFGDAETPDDEPERSSSQQSRSSRRSTDDDASSNEEIEKIWRLLDDLD